LYAALGGGLFFLPLNLIQVQGYSATAAGAALLPFILLIFLLSRWAGGLVAIYGQRLPLVVGPSTAGFGYLLLALPGVGGGYWVSVFPGASVLGLGMAISVAPLTTTVMGSVEKSHAGTASGINNAASRVAALLAVALFGLVMTLVFNTQLGAALATSNLSEAIKSAVQMQQENLAAIDLPSGMDVLARGSARQIINNAFVSGYRWIMVISAMLCFASAIAAWFFIENARPKPDQGIS
jgi:hypothetical protein